MQIRFCYALTAWLYYTQNKFLVLPRVGIFPIQYKVVLKIAAQKISRFTPCDIFATPSHFFESFKNLCFHFISVSVIVLLMKRREHAFRFSFLSLFLRSFICGENAHMSQTVNDTERKIKLETIFLAFRNVLI